MGRHMTRTTVALIALTTAACRVDGDLPQTGSQTPVGIIAPTPTPTPAPTPTPTLTPSSNSGTGELAIVSSGLDVNSLLGSKEIPPSAAPDVLGAFRFICGPGQLSYDDPIVHPGKPGNAHLHQFFGNLSANAHSTYSSLRAEGESTCHSDLNRSAYWMPALLDGLGNVIRPNQVAIYYKRRPSNDPWFRQNGNIPAKLPRGLRFVFGAPDRQASFKCVNGWNLVGSAGSMGHALQQCSAGQKLMVNLQAQACWDGKNLDSSDHRSHMDYGKSEGCPATHPYHIPVFSMTIEWSIEAGDVLGLWRFSSDETGMEPGSSFHSDWFGAWEDSVSDRWHSGCIENLLNCVDGNLGEGSSMKRNRHYPSGRASPRLVAIPEHPHH